MRPLAIARLSSAALLLAVLVLVGCSKPKPPAAFPYAINGVFVGMPAEDALNMVGAPPKALLDDYVRPGMRIKFYGGFVYSILGQILTDDKDNVVLSADVDGVKTVYKKLGQPSQTVPATDPHAYFNQILVYSKGDQLLVIPMNAKTNKIWALRLQNKTEGFNDMEN